jgi:hypothetical protein
LKTKDKDFTKKIHLSSSIFQPTKLALTILLPFY